ncbi:MAG: NADPH-dependent FMN reductase [Actinomycetota bacterium]
MVTTDGQIEVLAVSGSQRRGSYNAGLLRTLQGIAEQRGTIVITPLEGLESLPFASFDYIGRPLPESVQRVQEQTAAADGIIVATPEYCYSLPAMLKNYFDWQTLPIPPRSPLRHKPMGIVGASIGMMGSNRAQMDLRKIALYSDVEVMGRPEIYVEHAKGKFSEEGDLLDKETHKLLERWLDDYEEFVRSTLARDLPSLNREHLTT